MKKKLDLHGIKHEFADNIIEDFILLTKRSKLLLIFLFFFFIWKWHRLSIDSNPGLQDDRRRQIHLAMAVLSKFGLRKIIQIRLGRTT